jgi:hypothetical protein
LIAQTVLRELVTSRLTKTKDLAAVEEANCGMDVGCIGISQNIRGSESNDARSISVKLNTNPGHESEVASFRYTDFDIIEMPLFEPNTVSISSK